MKRTCLAMVCGLGLLAMTSQAADKTAPKTPTEKSTETPKPGQGQATVDLKVSGMT